MVPNLAPENFKNQTKLMAALSRYMKPYLDDPTHRERAGKSMLQSLTRHLEGEREVLPDIQFNTAQQLENEVVRCYIALASMQHSFGQCEYYFRRYPFNGLPVNHGDHLRNICEMYFDRIEQFRDRLKHLVNALKSHAEDDDSRYGEIIRNYKKFFKWECAQRNRTHHHNRFAYDAIDQLGLIDLLQIGERLRPTEMGKMLPQGSSIYRQEARKWANRVKEQTKALNTVVEFAAGLVLEKCSFLNAEEPA